MRNIIIMFVLSIVFFSCEKKIEKEVCFNKDPFELEWLQDAKDELIADTTLQLQQSIIMYKYNEEYVFHVDDCHACPDFGVSIMDCNKNQICFFGGIGGLNTCPDFYDFYTEIDTIYSE